ncbi:MAG: TorF family putative porin, partial [Caulobacterales bacterium]
ADDGAIAGDLDYLEVYGKASIAPVEPLTLGAAVFYSPEFPLKGGDAWYGEVNAGYTLTDALAVSGAFGYQTTKTNGYFAGDDNYMTWNIGATYSIAGFGLDVRYSDTDVSNADGYKDKFFVTLKRAL